MPSYEITSPDGAVYQIDGPEGSTPEQAMAIVQQQHAAAQPPESPGLGSRIGSDLAARAGEGMDIYKDMIKGNVTVPQAAFETAGKVLAGGAADVIGEGIKSGISELPQPVKQPVEDVGSAILKTPLGQAGVAAAKNGIEEYTKFKAANPIAARDLESAVNVGMFLNPAGKAAGEAAGTVRDAGTMIKDAMDAGKVTGLTGEAQTAALRKSAGDLYKESAAQDVQFGDQDVTKLSAALSGLKPKTDLELRSWNNSPAGKQVSDITDSLATENPSLNGLLAKRTELNSEIKVATRAGNDAAAQKLLRVKNALDETMMNGDASTWQKANHQWAQQAILGDTDEMVNKAATKTQPANSLDTAINNYLNSYKSNGLSDEERQALQAVTKNSSFDKLIKGGASGLLKYTTGAVGGHFGIADAAVGYLMGHYGSEFLKDTAMTSKLAKLDKFREIIAGRKLPVYANIDPNAISSPKFPEQLLLPSPSSPRAMTADEIVRAKAVNRKSAGNTGGLRMTPVYSGPAVRRSK